MTYLLLTYIPFSTQRLVEKQLSNFHNFSLMPSLYSGLLLMSAGHPLEQGFLKTERYCRYEINGRSSVPNGNFKPATVDSGSIPCGNFKQQVLWQIQPQDEGITRKRVSLQVLLAFWLCCCLRALLRAKHLPPCYFVLMSISIQNVLP